MSVIKLSHWCANQSWEGLCRVLNHGSDPRVRSGYRGIRGNRDQAAESEEIERHGFEGRPIQQLGKDDVDLHRRLHLPVVAYHPHQHLVLGQFSTGWIVHFDGHRRQPRRGVQLSGVHDHTSKIHKGGEHRITGRAIHESESESESESEIGLLHQSTKQKSTNII